VVSNWLRVVVSATGEPPASETLDSPELNSANTIAPLSLQAPPRKAATLGRLQMVCVAPLDTSTFFNVSWDVNPMKRLSGDQKMPPLPTPSVPASGRASDDSSE
jgi:hypothetical protein